MLYFYFSHFFTSFFIGLRRICLRAKVDNLVFIICSLLEGPDGVTDKLTATFSPMKKTLFRPQVQSLERFSGSELSKFSEAERAKLALTIF